MPEHPFHTRIPVGEALRALPLQAPPRSVWPSVAAQLPAPARNRLRPRLALVAGTVLAVVLWRWLAPAVQTVDIAQVEPVAAPTVADEEAALDALLRESAQLEAWIAFGGERASTSGADASLELDLQERIVAIDTLLARPALDPAAQRPLLQERLVRLRQLASLQNTRQLLAANGTDAQAAPVSVF